jgi:Cysteine-rich secretory protein family
MRTSSTILGWTLLCSQLVSTQNPPPKRDAKVVTITVTAPSSAPSASYTTLSILIDSALNSTNQFRSQHAATPLTWNTSLAATASTWASTCQWKHSGGPSGENLALGYPDMTTAIDAWGNERAHYDFRAPTGFSEKTGHFTQLVWKDTTSLGCAAVDCTGRNSLNGHILVCQYWPPGNMVGDRNEHFRTNVQAQVHAGAQRRSTDSTELDVPTRSRDDAHTTKTATVVQVATGFESVVVVMPVSTRARSSAWALGEEAAAAEQLEVRSMGRWAFAVAVAAMAVAGAIG